MIGYDNGLVIDFDRRRMKLSAAGWSDPRSTQVRGIVFTVKQYFTVDRIHETRRRAIRGREQSDFVIVSQRDMRLAVQSISPTAGPADAHMRAPTTCGERNDHQRQQ